MSSTLTTNLTETPMFSSEADEKVYGDVVHNRVDFIKTVSPSLHKSSVSKEKLKGVLLTNENGVKEYIDKILLYLSNDDRSLIDNLNITEKAYIIEILRELADSGYSDILFKLREIDYLTPPVSPEEFLLSKEYIGDIGQNLYEKLRPDFYRICASKEIVEVILTGAIGYGKSYMATLIISWLLYQLSCLRNPHKFYGLSENTPIVLMNLSVRAGNASSVIFSEVKALVDSTVYFKKTYVRNKRINDSLVFPNKVIFTPGGSTELSAVGQNLFGMAIDEMNFMDRVHGSVRSIDASGIYDQAQQIYYATSRRMKSRFMKQGKIPGKALLISSKRYPESFLEKHIERTKGDPTVYVIDKNQWEVKPDGIYSKDRFFIEIGDKTKNSVVFKTKEDIETYKISTKGNIGKVIEVPMEYYNDAERDLEGFLRDVAGISTYTTNPFIFDRSRIFDCSSDKTRLPITNKWYTNFEDGFTFLYENILENYVENGAINRRLRYFPEAPRYLSFDLSKCFTGDTKISLLDGTERSFETLYNSKLENFWVYTCAPDGTIDITKTVGGVKLTKHVSELVEVTLDNGESVRCTPDHKWMMRDGAYKEAKNLVSGDSLMPLYRKLSVDKKSKVYDYTEYRDNHTCTWEFVHRVASTHCYKGPRHTVRHHINFLKLDNTPENIKWMSGRAHFYYHSCILGKTQGIVNLLTYLHSSRCSEDLKERWKAMTVEERNLQGQKAAKTRKQHALQDPEFRKKEAEWADKTALRNTQKWEKTTEEEKIKIINNLNNCREIKKLVDPEFKQHMYNVRSEISKNSHKKHKEEGINWFSPLKGKNNNDEMKRKQKLGKIVKVFTVLKELGLPITEGNYRKCMKNGIPFPTKYFSSFDEAKTYVLLHNHRVQTIKFIKLESSIPVYDIETESDNHNFALTAGVFVHNSGDKTGICSGCLAGHKQIQTVDQLGKVINVYKPIIFIDFAVKVYPSSGLGEIDYQKITEFVEQFANAGYPIAQMSFDSFQSTYHGQIFKSKGYEVVYLSVDRTPDAYNASKEAILEKRINLPKCEDIYTGTSIVARGLQTEFVELEKSPEGKAPDHPINGSKDLIDAVSGVVKQIIDDYAPPAQFDKVFLYSGDPVEELQDIVSKSPDPFALPEALMRLKEEDDEFQGDTFTQWLEKM